jgi:hypothetical protein
MASMLFTFGITLIMTTYFIFAFVFSCTERFGANANVALTTGAIIAAPVVWYYAVFPIIIFAIR